MLNLSAVDENKDIATKEYVDTKVSKSGDTMTGRLNLQSGQYTDSYSVGALNLNNSNILGVNSLYTADASDSAQEGIHFYRDSTHVDSIHAKSGKLYFTPNRTLGTNGTPQEIYTAGSTFPEAYLSWGGRDFSAAYGCVDAAMVGALGANRFELLKAAGITIEYSRDGGSTWTDYGATDAYKREIFTSIPYVNSITVGKIASGETATVNWKVRVILSFPAAGLYTVLNKFVFLVTTNGATGCTVTIDGTRKSDESTWVTFKSNIGIGGWSGWNVVNYPTGITTYANNTSQFSKVRFTFSIGGLTSGYTNALTIYNILGFGGVGWATPSNLAKHGHAYTWDTDENAIFKGIKNSPIYFDATSCPEISGTPTYLLGIDAYASGGRVRYKNVSNISVGSATSATNATNATNANKAKQLVPDTIRPTSANTDATNTTALIHYLATSSMTTGKPMADGHIIECDWDNTGGWKGQLYIPNSSSTTSNHLQWRGQNGGTTWGNWVTVLDSNSTINAATVGGHTVNSDVPANAVFTDTDTKVKQTSKTSGTYPLMLTGATSPTSGSAAEANYNANVKVDTSAGNLQATKFNGLTLTAASTGFTIAGGTTSKTLTVNNTYTLAAACAKGVDTSMTSTSTSTNLPTTKAVVDYVNSQSSVTGADYITAQGTSNGWVYRKWNSGIAECWGNFSHSSVSISSKSGNAWYSGEIYETFPSSLFNASPSYCDVSANPNAGVSFEVASGLSSTRTQAIYLMRLEGSATVSVWLQIHAIGTWK